MGEAPSIYPNLSHQKQFSLKKICKVKDFVIAEIREREAMSKEFSKYIAVFDYFNKALIFLICNKWWNIYCLFWHCYWCTCRDSNCKFQFCVLYDYMKLLKTKRNNKHNKIVTLARSKLNSTKTMISKALISNYKKEKYKKLKEDSRMIQNQKIDPEKDKLIEEDKRIEISEIIRQINGNNFIFF